jgi:hypothetical protein
MGLSISKSTLEPSSSIVSSTLGHDEAEGMATPGEPEPVYMFGREYRYRPCKFDSVENLELYAPKGLHPVLINVDW